MEMDIELKGTNPEDWIHGAAVVAKQDYSEL